MREFPRPGELQALFGDLDIYLFDQLLKGRITAASRLLDAGCGGGRNLSYLLRCGVPVSGVDRSAGAVAEVRRLARELSPRPLSEYELSNRFREEAIEDLSFADASFDVVVANAVLHFASGEAHFRAMVRQLGRVLTPGGMLFCRLSTTIGFEGEIEPLGDGRYHLPEGSDRYLATEARLHEETARLGTLLEPLKTTRVENLRTMTTWVVRKG